jgi:hypothetical protein
LVLIAAVPFQGTGSLHVFFVPAIIFVDVTLYQDHAFDPAGDFFGKQYNPPATTYLDLCRPADDESYPH